jgi:hypothetical protein
MARLTIEFPTEYNKNYCERPERMARLQELAVAVAGRHLQLEMVIAERTRESQEARPAPVSRRQRWLELEGHPLVAQARQLFDADVIDVQEPRRPERSPPATEP